MPRTYKLAWNVVLWAMTDYNRCSPPLRWSMLQPPSTHRRNREDGSSTFIRNVTNQPRDQMSLENQKTTRL
jgi:hypothetical protein